MRHQFLAAFWLLAILGGAHGLPAATTKAGTTKTTSTSAVKATSTSAVKTTSTSAVKTTVSTTVKSETTSVGPEDTDVVIPEAEIDVTTIEARLSTMQIPESPDSTPDPATMGDRITTLEREAESSVYGGGSTLTSTPTSVPAPTNTPVYTAPFTIDPLHLARRSANPPRVAPVRPRKASRASVREGSEARMEKRQVAAVTSNLFAVPIATSTPPGLFSRRYTHPVSRKFISDPASSPAQTNKFYANMFLSTQRYPAYTHPYSVWQRLEGGSLGISHVDTDQRVFGPINSSPSAKNGATEYYLSPIRIVSMSLGFTEFNTNVTSMDVSKLDQFSAQANFYANKSKNATQVMSVPMCLGMGFVTAEYSGLTPVIESEILFKVVTLTSSPRDGVTKYKVLLTDNKTWLIYMTPDPAVPADPPFLTVVANGRMEAASPFWGSVQIAKLDNGTAPAETTTAMEAALDQASGGWCVGGSVDAQVSGNVGTYQIIWTRKNGVSPLMMWSLPHHWNSFETTTAAAIKAGLNMWSSSKGKMKAVVADTWRLKESNLPTNLGFIPVKTGTPAVINATNLKLIATQAGKDALLNFTALAVQESMYWSGKNMGKFADLCLADKYVLRDNNLTGQCLTKLKKAFSYFLNNQQPNKLVYDYTWRGVVSDATYKYGDPYADFGNTFYNDHHFHYGYFIRTAAAIAHLDSLGLPGHLPAGTWLPKSRDWINTLIRDVANPSKADTYFPVSRSFDWFGGHSWAKGLFESADGKDQESSSEDVNFAYAMMLWGRVTGQKEMEARGALMLGVLNRSVNTYFLIHYPPITNIPHPLNPTPTDVHPDLFSLNLAVGILFENKAHHTTYFGALPQYAQGVHMLPFTAATVYTRTANFVNEEWIEYFLGRTGLIDDGWKSVLYANYALTKPIETWKLSKQSGFRGQWLDAGISRTWLMSFAALLGGAAI